MLVTAAFIGPGTVVTASKAGAHFGCQLLWTVLFACVGTIVLQSLAARLGIVTGHGLGEAIRHTLGQSRWLRGAITLVIAAIGIGNAAYQTGNFTGAVAGITSVSGGNPSIWVLGLAVATATIITVGKYRVLQRVLIALVVLLSLSFLVTGLISFPPVGRLADGIFVPRVNAESLSVVLGLIGTTIVPYNLFLHASGAATTWRSMDPKLALVQAKWDTILSISLGGFVTASILVTASAAFFDTHTPWRGTEQIAEQLRPTLGASSGFAFALGLFAAGLTSAITAPLATAFAVCGCLGWDAQPASSRFRLIALSVIASGAILAISLGKSPAITILFAQIANGLLLPVIAVFLLVVVKKRCVADNLPKPNLSLAWLIVACVGCLGLWRVVSALA